MGLKKIVFDWDQWNLQKNEMKHGVARDEAESVFLDPHHCVFEDERHSTGTEKRYIYFGIGMLQRVLMVGFTIRQGKIRIITARPASKKERGVYEEQKETK